MKYLKYCHDCARPIGLNEDSWEGFPMYKSCKDKRRRKEART